MQDVGAGWLMTSLSPTPLMVSLVQTAITVPMFLLAIPAGAMADLFDRKRLLLITQTWLSIVALVLALLTWTGNVTPTTLLAITFMIGLGVALVVPAMSAVIPDLVPRHELPGAIALNSMGFNLSRAIGPALAGIIISKLGVAAVFAFNALSYLCIITALVLWKPEVEKSALPVERFFSAMRTGLRYVKYSSPLRVTLFRGGTFFLFGSVIWALMPLISRQQIGGGPETFGLMVGCLGLGAVMGALNLARLRRYWSDTRIVQIGSFVLVAALISLSQASHVVHGLLSVLVAGSAWLSVLSTVFVAAQLSLPGWVRGRGLSVFMSVFMGSLAAGSLTWGAVANVLGLSLTVIVAAGGLAVITLVTTRVRLPTVSDDSDELEPSRHWQVPETRVPVDYSRGPVMITVDYHVREECREDFLATINELGASRRRDGAYFWSHFEDTADPCMIREVFLVESWAEHLRQHERVTRADQQLQLKVNEFLQEGARPQARHFVHERSAKRLR